MSIKREVKSASVYVLLDNDEVRQVLILDNNLTKLLSFLRESGMVSLYDKKENKNDFHFPEMDIETI
jgi:hypothetical protein